MQHVSIRLVFDRKHVATQTQTGLVQLVVICNGKRKYFGTDVKLYAGQWNKEGKVQKHPNALLINQMLSEMVSRAYDYANDTINRKAVFSFEKLGAVLRGEDIASPDSFLEYMRERIEERGVAEGTKIRQRCVLKALREFGKIQTFSDLTFANIKRWDDFAKQRCAKQSSVYNYHKILKTFVREAYTDQLINHDPYKGFKLDHGQTNERRFLTKEELHQLETTEIENQSLRQVRDMFLFCCYTGLAYADLAKFDFDEAVFTEGMYRIKDTRTKTGTVYYISLIDSKHSVNHVFSSPTSIINFTSKKPSYDDTRRSGRDNELLQRAQNDL